MRKIIVLSITCCLFACTNQIKNSIGEQSEENKYVLHQNVKDSLVLVWNGVLLSNNIKTNVSDIKIVSNTDRKTGKKYFGVLGLTKNDSAKLICETELIDSNFYFKKGKVFSMAICFGSGNCDPVMVDGNWSCDDGSDSESCSLNCRKISIVTVKD